MTFTLLLCYSMDLQRLSVMVSGLADHVFALLTSYLYLSPRPRLVNTRTNLEMDLPIYNIILYNTSMITCIIRNYSRGALILLFVLQS
jgi:hypothetical protein